MIWPPAFGPPKYLCPIAAAAAENDCGLLDTGWDCSILVITEDCCCCWLLGGIDG